MASATMICPRCWGAKARAAVPCEPCGATGVRDDVVLAPHFRLSEMLRSQTALRRAIPNEPTAAHVDALRELCVDLLEPVRAKFGPLRVTSGLRVTALHRAVTGGTSRSAHEIGGAADFVPADPKKKLKSVVEWIAASSLPFDQVIFEGTWVHVGRRRPSGGALRRQALMMFPDAHGKATYAKYDAADPRVA
jgi:zinc D-Ala-D-Ala carboxypeptidase